MHYKETTRGDAKKAKYYYKNAILQGLGQKKAVKCWINYLLVSRAPEFKVLSFLDKHKYMWAYSKKATKFERLRNTILELYQGSKRSSPPSEYCYNILLVRKLETEREDENVEIFIRRKFNFDAFIRRAEKLYASADAKDYGNRKHSKRIDLPPPTSLSRRKFSQSCATYYLAEFISGLPFRDFRDDLSRIWHFDPRIDSCYPLNSTSITVDGISYYDYLATLKIAYNKALEPGLRSKNQAVNTICNRILTEAREIKYIPKSDEHEAAIVDPEDFPPKSWLNFKFHL